MDAKRAKSGSGVVGTLQTEKVIQVSHGLQKKNRVTNNVNIQFESTGLGSRPQHQEPP